MDPEMVAYLYAAVSLLFLNVASKKDVSKDFILRPDPKLGPSRLSKGWTDLSLMSCMASCLISYPTSCQSVMYNHVTRLCTPGQWLSSSEARPSEEEGDLFATYQCGSSKGFNLRTYGQTKVCVAYDDNGKSYASALAECQKYDSHLYVIHNNMDKFKLLQEYIKNRCWVGLDDLQDEGVYLWGDTNEELDPASIPALFAPGEPNDYNSNEDCVCMYYTTKMLNDDNCTSRYDFICEKDL